MSDWQIINLERKCSKFRNMKWNIFRNMVTVASVCLVPFLINIHPLSMTCEMETQSWWCRYACICAEMQSGIEEQKDRMTENYSSLSINDMLEQVGSSLSGDERVGRWRGCRLRARAMWGSARPLTRHLLGRCICTKTHTLQPLCLP